MHQFVQQPEKVENVLKYPIYVEVQDNDSVCVYHENGTRMFAYSNSETKHMSNWDKDKLYLYTCEVFGDSIEEHMNHNPKVLTWNGSMDKEATIYEQYPFLQFETFSGEFLTSNGMNKRFFRLLDLYPSEDPEGIHYRTWLTKDRNGLNMLIHDFGNDWCAFSGVLNDEEVDTHIQSVLATNPFYAEPMAQTHE